jgi:hypothetical protein
MIDSEKFAPLQIHGDLRSGKIPWAVHMMAYEVYSGVFGPQEAMVDLEGRNCRGGFGIAELIAFLYARNFPHSEWCQRVDEALKGLESR